jgi:hypothetical protein
MAKMMVNMAASKCCGSGNAVSQRGACWVDYSHVCQTSSDYTPTAEGIAASGSDSAASCDQAMAYYTGHPGQPLLGLDFSSAFNCGGQTDTVKNAVYGMAAKCCGSSGTSTCPASSGGSSSSGSAEWGWVTSSTNNICAGIITNCNDKTTCTTVGVGPCEGSATKPTAYLKSNLEGLALVKEATYLTDSSHMSVIQTTGLGYRDSKKDIAYTAPGSSAKTSDYAYTMSGNIFGGKAYAGVASYLVTGAGDITSKTNNFYVATDATNTARVDRSTTSTSESDSGIGAPLGPFKVCIGKYDDSAADKCGAARVYEAGEYKFSIFGHIFDTVDFTGYDHVGFRMKLTTVGFKADELKVNGATWSSSTQNQNVQSMELVSSSGEKLMINFPQDYNVGTTSGADASGVNMMTVTAGKTVKIKVHSVSKTDVLIDYLFETASLGTGKYFVYDPTITESHVVTPTTSSAPAPASASAPAPASESLGVESAGTVAQVTIVAGVVSVFAVLFGSL